MSNQLTADQAPKPGMAQNTVKNRIEEVVTMLEKNDKVVLHGKRGVGKSWMAMKLSQSEYAVRKFDVTIWIFLNRKYDETALYENIAWQLSLFPAHEELDIDGEDNEQNGEEKEKQEGADQKEGQEKKEKAERLDKLKEQLIMLAKKRCLLILDGGDQESEEKAMALLQFWWHLDQKPLSKVLATRREKGIDERVGYFEVEPLLEDDAMSLLRERDTIAISEKLRKAIIEKSGGLPAAIIAITEVLNHIVKCDSGVWTQEHAFDEVISIMEGDSFQEASENLIELLCRGYDKSPNDNVISKCCWHSIQYFQKHHEVHYNELITHWIMEGFYDPVDHLEEAYEMGHRVLMLFIDSGFLKKQEDNVVTMAGAAELNMTDRRRLGFDGESNLGLPSVQGKGKNWTGLGRVIKADGMINTYVRHPRKWAKVSTLLVDGNRLCKEIPETFFQNMPELHILCLLNPRFRSLPVSLFETDKLLVLSLRGCDLLEKIYHIQKLKSLIVLEISGARPLKRVPEDLFKEMTSLESLNLSSVQVNSLPSSLYELVQLRWLVLKDCSRLVTLKSLQKLVNLEVLVLSGSTSFKKFVDRTFQALQKLRILDLSYTSIERLPFFHSLNSFKRLILRGCVSLHVLPSLKHLSSLLVLDVHGATEIKQLPYESMENKKDLQILDLSKTKIVQLPSNISSLSELYLSSCSELSKLPRSEAMEKLKILDLSDTPMLSEIEDKFFDNLSCLGSLHISKAKVAALPSLSNLTNLHHLSIKDCKELKELPSVEALVKLEVLDLSGCSELNLKQDESFQKMARLQRLDLSETKVEHLPSLPSPSNLRHLLLRGCTKLTKLPELESQSKLEELDICGENSLKEIKAQFLEHMSQLRILKSETPLVELPSMDRLIKELKQLEQLKLSSCPELKDVTWLEALTKLEVLDLSGSGVTSLPSLSPKLRELWLTDCQNLKEVPSLESLALLEVLSLRGTGITKFPYEITQLAHLQRLDLPESMVQGIEWSNVMYLPEKLNWEQWRTTKTDAKFFEFLEKHPVLQDAYFKQFHIYFHGDEQHFKETYSQVRHIPYTAKQGAFLEFRGSYSIPEGFESILGQAEGISLVDIMDTNPFTPLSKFGSDTLKAVKRCCLERCLEMKSLLSGGYMDDLLKKEIETLWVSNLPKLQSIDKGVCFEKLQHLYLDCCPMIQYVFLSDQVPQNLETLQVTFCDNLQMVFKNDNEEDRCTLTNLKTLYLLELPKLKRIGAVFPYAKSCEIKECPQVLEDYKKCSTHH